MNRILFSFLFSLLLLLSSHLQADEYCNLQRGDKVRLIKQEKLSLINVYIFTDVSSCLVCNLSINPIFEAFDESRGEIQGIVFYNGLSDKQANEEKSKQEISAKVLGDEYGFIQSYYKMKSLPVILVLDAEGKVLDWGKLAGGVLTADSILSIYASEKAKQLRGKRNPFEMSNYFKELQRLKVVQYDGTAIKSGRFRDVVFNKTKKEFYLRNVKTCPLMIIDSNGVVVSTVQYGRNQEYECFFPLSMGWCKKDSLLLLYSSADSKPHFQIYDTHLNKLSRIVNIDLKTDSLRNTYGNRGFTIASSGCLVIGWKNSPNLNFRLSERDTVFHVYDLNGSYKFGFDTPNSAFTKQVISEAFDVNFAEVCMGTYISKQQYSKTLKFWDRNFKLLKSHELSLDSTFRYLKKDTLKFGSAEDNSFFFNNSSVFSTLLADTVLNRIMFVYQNERYKEDEFNPYSSDVVIKKYLHLCDYNGKKKIPVDLEMPNLFTPFYYENGTVWASEVRNNELDLVQYQVILE